MSISGVMAHQVNNRAFKEMQFIPDNALDKQGMGTFRYNVLSQTVALKNWKF